MPEAQPPIVSVIVPTYNRAGLIAEAVRSVLAQDFASFELIVVDDGSTDATANVMAEFKDARLRYVVQPNRGRSNARNHALSLARGRYIAFLDSDDVYLPGKLSLQVDFMDAHPDVGMVYTSARCIDAAGALLREEYIASVSGAIYEAIAFFKPVTITLPTVMVRADILHQVGGFDEQMHRFEDTDMWRRISNVTFIQAMPEFTCLLRTHGDNRLAAQNARQIIQSLHYYARKIRQEDAAIPFVKKRQGLAALYGYYAYAFFTVPAWRARAVGLLLWSVWYWPTVFITRFALPFCQRKWARDRASPRT